MSVRFFFIVFLYFGYSFAALGKSLVLFKIPINANDDLLYTFENTEVECPVLSNDYGIEGFNVELSIVNQPLNGISRVLDDNSIYYKPDVNFQGREEIVYRVCANGQCDEATLIIQVSDWDFKPEAVPDSFLFSKGEKRKIDVLENDIDIYDVPLSVSIVTDISNGKSFVNADGEIEIVFGSYFIGNDSLIYELCDKEGDCAQAIVYFDVINSGDLDVFVPGGFSPNGDGINETFLVPEFEYYKISKQLSLTVVSRWGELVYESKSYQNDWNGTANRGSFSGKLLPSGSYYYSFYVGGNSKPLTGCVYINH